MSARSFKFKLAAVALAASSAYSFALAQSLPASDAEGSRLWFVEFAGKTVSDGATVAAVQA